MTVCLILCLTKFPHNTVFYSVCAVHVCAVHVCAVHVYASVCVAGVFNNMHM